MTTILPPPPGDPPAPAQRPETAISEPKRGPGRPPGSKSLAKATSAPQGGVIERIFTREAERVAEATILAATVGGDPRSQALVLSRIYPLRDARVLLPDCPPLRTIDDVLNFHRWLIQQVGAGRLSPAEASALGNLTARFCEAVANLELEKRLNLIEDKLAESGRRL